MAAVNGGHLELGAGAGLEHVEDLDVVEGAIIAGEGAEELAPVTDGAAVSANIIRGAAPGLFTFTVSVPPGHAGGSFTFGATFDGAPIVQPATIPIALDSWTAGYPESSAGGGCDASPARANARSFACGGLFVLGLLARRRRAR